MTVKTVTIRRIKSGRFTAVIILVSGKKITFTNEYASATDALMAVSSYCEENE